MLACASGLARDLTDKAPGSFGLEEEIDLGGVEFTEIATGQSLTILDYMERNEKDYLLISFGSMSCSACNHKAEQLTNRIIGRHPLYATDAGKRFEVVGINTDPGNPRQLTSHVAAFPFIRWSDPSGLQMVSYFMPVDRKFSVPLTVMLSRKGILWRVLPDDPMTVDDMMDKVSSTLGMDAKGPDGPDGPDDPDGPDGPVIVPSSPLAKVGPHRLNGVRVQDCDRSQATLGQRLRGDVFRFLQIVRGDCDATCQANVRELQVLEAACKETAKGCVTALLQAPSATNFTDIDNNLCASEWSKHVFTGGGEFFDTFKTLFNWRYIPTEDPASYELSMPEVQGPLILGFNSVGQIVFVREGLLAKGELAARWRSSGFTSPVPGPEFPLYAKDKGEFKFSSLLTQAEYTVVAAWGAYPIPCSSCIAELKHWSAPGQLYDFCKGRQNQCQIVALETHLPDEGGDQSMESFFDGILYGDGETFDGFQALGIRVPLVLDPVPLYGDDGRGYLKRFFDGYLVASMPSLGFEYRAVIFDREGKIVSAFKAAPPGDNGVDPVLQTLQRMIGE
jgi:hypothetical protein